jgi:hypothetical protein
MFRDDRGEDSAAYEKLGRQAHEARRYGSDEIIEYLVGDRLVERALVTVRPDVEFERFSGTDR